MCRVTREWEEVGEEPRVLKQPPCPESICRLRRDNPILRRASSVLMLLLLQAVHAKETGRLPQGQAGVQTLTLPPISSVSLGKFLNISEPPLLYLCSKVVMSMK